MDKKRLIIIVVLAGIFLELFVIILFVAILFLSSNPQLLPGDKVALVEIIGSIRDSQDVVAQLQRYEDDDSIKAIVLRIDSPGGVVAPVQEIYRELTKIQKGVVVSMGSVAASGAYYIACAADRIFANPGTVTGSIGVIMQFPNVGGLMKKLGVKQEVVKSGRYKDSSSYYRGLTQEEKELFQKTIDDVYNQFLDAIVEGRQSSGLTRERIQEIADGRILSGRQALEMKLIDELGDLNDAIKYAGKLGGIEGKPRVIRARIRRSIMDRLLGGVLGSELSQVMPHQAVLRYELVY